jgi:hypothetical protein
LPQLDWSGDESAILGFASSGGGARFWLGGEDAAPPRLYKEFTYRTKRVPACPVTSASTSSRSTSGRFWGMVNFSAAMALP